MLRDLVVCLLCGAAFCVLLWLACGSEPPRAQDAVRMEFLERRVEHERARADKCEAKAPKGWRWDGCGDEEFKVLVAHPAWFHLLFRLVGLRMSGHGAYQMDAHRWLSWGSYSRECLTLPLLPVSQQFAPRSWACTSGGIAVIVCGPNPTAHLAGGPGVYLRENDCSELPDGQMCAVISNAAAGMLSVCHKDALKGAMGVGP